MDVPTPFRIFDASAGAGKTYNLVFEYLSLCLSRKGQKTYREILAVTFTKKAAAEMRERVLAALEGIWKGEKDAISLRKKLAERLGIGDQEIQERAGITLHHMLHDFANINLMTIDSFTHRILRTFSNDLELGAGFEPEMDVERPIQEAVDLLMSRVGVDENITKQLLSFVNAKMREDKNWNIDKDLLKAAKELTQEASMDQVEFLSKSKLEDLVNAHAAVGQKIKDCESKITNCGDGIEKAFVDFGMTITQITGGKSQWEWIMKWKSGEVKPLSEANLKRFLPGGMFKKTDKVDDLTEQGIIEQAKPYLEEGKEIIKDVRWLKEIQKNMYSLLLLSEMEKEYDAIKQSQNILPISDFNKIIHKEIKDQPAPYIYERLGERYKYFFLDEFQDTSAMQWANIFPLIENALAQGGQCMVVGDAKQSIYRFRNGNPEQFIDITKWAESQPHSFKTKHVRMPDNWRSRKGIVDFNNRFFKAATMFSDNPNYGELYRHAGQNPQGEDGGYVEINWLTEEASADIEKESGEKVVSLVKGLIEEGNKPGDIAILTRKGSEGSNLATLLAAEKINVVGSDTLYVRNSKEVNLLYNCLLWLNDPDNRRFRLAILEGMIENGVIQDMDPSKLYLSPEIKRSRGFEEFLKGFCPELSFELKGGMFALLEDLSRAFGFLNAGNAFVFKFLDEVFAFSQRPDASIANFIEFWERKSNGQAIEVPESDDAVKIMTLHKSKGLEFPIVIIPRVDWHHNNRIEADWYNTEKYGFPYAKIKPGSKDEDPALLERYKEKVAEARFDNLNLLYVGMTRAVDQLYLFPLIPDSKSKSNNQHSVTQLFHGLFQETNQETRIYKEGTKPHPAEAEEKNDTVTLDQFYSRDWKNVAEISRTAPADWENKGQSPQYWGNLVHQVFEESNTLQPWEMVVQKWTQSGKINGAEASKISMQISKLYQNEAIAKVLSLSGDVFAERDILLPNGEMRRPDRVVKTADTWWIIDFKTGEKKNAHKKQVEEYGALLCEIEELACKHCLIYVDEENPELVEF